MTARAVLRAVLVVLAVVAALYVVYRLRRVVIGARSNTTIRSVGVND